MRTGIVFALGAAVLAAGFSRVHAQATSPQYPRAILINFDPILENQANRRLHTAAGWNDATTLTNGYIADLKACSHNLVNYRVVQTINADVFPIKLDGFRYTDASYWQCYSTWSGWHTPDGVDYKAVIRDYDLARRTDWGEIDEVLMHGAPYFGYWESTMAGRNGYWCNSSPQTRIACSKIFVIMGFNYERGIGEMLEDYGHRTESIMWKVYGSWSAQQTHAWNRFTLYDLQIPGEAACGNVHFAPNSTSDYDWGNTTYVWSYCDDWLNNYPNLQNTKKWVNCTEWGNGDIRLHHKWWFTHIPHVAGSLTEYGMTRLNNWWEYMQNFNAYPESNGDFALGGAPPPAQPYPAAPLAVTATAAEDWAPRANAAGRIVWHSSDRHIYSAYANGTGLVRLTTAYINEYPVINNVGRVVWQAFDGTDYEIFSANADGTGLVRITNNSVDDRHPQINDNNKVVWDSFDGADYEIFSANADGTGLVQITNNASTLPTKPLEDVWPQINNADRVVWMGYDGTNWEIFSANADGTGLVNVSNNAYENEYPQISSTGRVVWHAWHTNTNSEIYSADATGGPVTRLTNNTYEDWYPQINASGLVVWMGRIGGDWEIFQRGATGGSTTQITNNSSHDTYPQISPTGQVVWQGFDGNDWEIYLYDAGTIYQLSDNAYHDRAPQISPNGLVTWHGESFAGTNGNTHDIFATNTQGNTPPVAQNGSAQTAMNTPVTITLQGSSPSGNPLDFIITSLPGHGELADPNAGWITTVPYTLVNRGQAVRFRPTLGYVGDDAFQFKVHDGNDSLPAVISITVGGSGPVYAFPLDTNPGWTTQGQWAFGQPTGGGGQHGSPDPIAGRTGPNVYGYNLSGDYGANLPETHLTTTAIDCSRVTQTRLKFWRWLGVEQPAYDHAYVRVSNNGTTWTNVWQNTAEVADSSWVQVDYDISAVADGQPTVFIRWTMGPTDGSWFYCGWNIDDIEIWGNVPGETRPGDLDRDGDVDLADFAMFQTCFNGPNRPAAAADCGAADADGDDDVDLADFAAFQTCFNGPNRYPACE